jgi:hypothetical protein
VKTAQGTAPAIPCEQVFYSPGHPTIDSEFQAKETASLRAAVSPALWSFHAPLATLRQLVGVAIAKDSLFGDAVHRITSRWYRLATAKRRCSRHSGGVSHISRQSLTRMHNMHTVAGKWTLSSILPGGGKFA